MGLMQHADTFLMERTWAVGVDLGQSHDPTAIAIAEQIAPKWSENNFGREQRGLFEALRPEIHIRHLERLKLGTTYPQQVEHVANLMERPSLAVHRPYAYIDYTGVGRPVFDMFGAQKRVHRLQGITITGGRETLSTDVGWSVPKGELVSLLQAKLHSGDLKVAKALPDAAVLLRELQDFRVRFTEAGNATFNAREGAHDDLVLAVALAVFGLSRSQWATEIKVVWPG